MESGVHLQQYGDSMYCSRSVQRCCDFRKSCTRTRQELYRNRIKYGISRDRTQTAIGCWSRRRGSLDMSTSKKKKATKSILSDSTLSAVRARSCATAKLRQWKLRHFLPNSIKNANNVPYPFREVYALENDKAPKPRRENRIYGSKFIPFLGYSVKTYTDWPVRDTKWGLLQQQTRAIRFLDSMAAK